MSFTICFSSLLGGFENLTMVTEEYRLNDWGRDSMEEAKHRSATICKSLKVGDKQEPYGWDTGASVLLEAAPIQETIKIGNFKTQIGSLVLVNF